MNMIFKLFSAGALMFLGVACTSCEKENENNKESDIPMEQVSYKASNEIIVNPERGFYKATSCEMGTSPPELVADVSTNGIIMTGGGSLVYGFDKLVTARTGIHTTVADDAISCVVLGTGKSLDSLNAMQDGTMNLSRRKQMT